MMYPGDILGIGSILALLGGGIGAINSGISYSQSKKLMAMQQNWLEKMSNTAHQREVADLRAAGLNPILSAGGNGASAGGAGLNSSSVSNGPDLTGILDTAVAAENANTTAKAQASQEAVNDSQIELNKAQAGLAAAKAVKEAEGAKVYKSGGKLYDLIKDPITWRGVLSWFSDSSGSAKNTPNVVNRLKKAKQHYNGDGTGNGRGNWPSRVPEIEIRKGRGVPEGGSSRIRYHYSNGYVSEWRKLGK